MKKLFSLLFIALMFFSCGKEQNSSDENSSGGSGNSGGGNTPKLISSISLVSPSTTLLSVASEEGKLIELTLSPDGCTTDMLNVQSGTDGIITWTAVAKGILVKPVKIGETVLTIGPKSGPATPVSVTVKVLSADDYASVPISNIQMETSVALLDSDPMGKVLSVVLTPSEATPDMLKWSGGDDVVTVTAVSGGLKFVPIKVGSAQVTVEARQGTAAKKVIEVLVLNKDEYSEYVISDIKYSPETVGVKDNGTVDVTLDLTPAAATVADIVVSSDNTSFATVEKLSGKVIRITGKKPGNTTISVRGVRDGSKSIKIPVTVYGHVTSLSISPSSGLEVLKGSEITLTATIQKTGTLKDGEAVEWSSDSKMDDVNMLSLSPYNSAATKTCKVGGYRAGGASSPAKVTATLEDCSATVNVTVYDLATGIEASGITGDTESESSATNLKKGKTYTINWKVLPATAKQDGEVQFASSVVTVSTARYSDHYVTTIQVNDAKTDKYTLTIIPVNKSSSGRNYYKDIYLNQYFSYDIKPGDYVYYNSSNSRFYWSDGGLRCAEKYSVRKVSKSKDTSLGTLIGQVYDESTPSDPAFLALNPRGFANKNGAHARVLSIDVAYEEGESVDYWRWTESNENVYEQTTWTGGPYGSLAGGLSDMDYSFKLNIIYFNKKSGSSYDIKPGYVVTSFDKVTFGNFGDVSNHTTYSSLDHTGWMLPLRSTAKNKITAFSGNDCYKQVFSAMNNFKIGGDTITPWEKDYWTAEQYDKDNTYYFNFEQVTYKNKGNSLSNWEKPYVRPILWL